MSSKFEKLIEYVINDEEQKARDLFHEIVVEKSRGIYEDLMAAELKEESDEDLEESADEEMEESMEMETMGGDAADQLMNDIRKQPWKMTKKSWTWVPKKKWLAAMILPTKWAQAAISKVISPALTAN